MMWTQDRVRLSKLLAEGYEIDCSFHGGSIVYIIADPQLMRYEACENHNDKSLMALLSDTAAYYDEVFSRYMAKEYTPDTNQTEILEKTWDFGVIGATYLPDAIRLVWSKVLEGKKYL